VSTRNSARAGFAYSINQKFNWERLRIRRQLEIRLWEASNLVSTGNSTRGGLTSSANQKFNWGRPRTWRQLEIRLGEASNLVSTGNSARGGLTCNVNLEIQLEEASHAVSTGHSTVGGLATSVSWKSDWERLRIWCQLEIRLQEASPLNLLPMPEGFGVIFGGRPGADSQQEGLFPEDIPGEYVCDYPGGYGWGEGVCSGGNVYPGVDPDPPVLGRGG